MKLIRLMIAALALAALTAPAVLADDPPPVCWPCDLG